MLALLVAMAVPLLLSYSGLTIRLGAHPRRAMSSALIGAAVGLLVALGLGVARLRRGISMLVTVLAMVLAGVAAHFGKEVFVASYAENGLAGRFWYFGWNRRACERGDAIRSGIVATPAKLRSSAVRDFVSLAGARDRHFAVIASEPCNEGRGQGTKQDEQLLCQGASGCGRYQAAVHADPPAGG